MLRKCLHVLSVLGSCIQHVASEPNRPPSRMSSCPQKCHVSGYNPANWTAVATFGQANACEQPMLLDYSIVAPTDEPQFIRTCSMGHYHGGESYFNTTMGQDEESVDVMPVLGLITGKRSEKAGSGLNASMVVWQLESHLRHNEAKAWEKTILFSSFNGTSAGVFIGQDLLNPSALSALVNPVHKALGDSIQEPGTAVVAQVCGEDKDSSSTFGIIAAATSDMGLVTDAVRKWANATCVDVGSASAQTGRVKPVKVQAKKQVGIMAPSRNSTRLMARAECRTVQVREGNGCDALARRCGIHGDDFMKYNPDICGTLMPGQHVCCTEGSLPDLRPKANPDGSCFVYTTVSGDYCASIAAAHSLKVSDLEDLNRNTWGWSGCERLWSQSRICLSKGRPPMPAPISNSVCGPMVPGTKAPTDDTDIAELNPCPLNVCCNIWGQCGTTADFCVDTRGDGAPGTAAPGTYGCISNCGNDIIQSDPPAQFIKLGYFEAFNFHRDCLNMEMDQIDQSFTHLHFAFGMISPDFEIYLEDDYARYHFERFKKLKGFKRIISFGGWTFSAEAPWYTIMRNGVKTAENREKLATNLVSFVHEHQLDGVDIDWEYPGAPDIPGIPAPDDEFEPINYALLLSLIRSKLRDNISLSICAPASYWYLKQFPIAGMSRILDYIVFMTYDLHGQWDSGNEWATPGCPTGNCLRSHVNITETLDALSMITKAGVKSDKILVGVSSYGRSFRMADASCTGPDCLYLGGNGRPGESGSQAQPGRCTSTSGYISNAEISEYLETGGRMWYDSKSESNIMVYESDNWVGYMNEAVKARRTAKYKELSMGGTIDWALDLARWHESPSPELRYSTWLSLKTAILSNGANPGKVSWKEIRCRDIKNIEEPGPRWERAGAGDAWIDLVSDWNDKGNKNSGLSLHVGKFFDSDEGQRCQVLAPDNFCKSWVKCEDNMIASGPLIQNSFSAISSILWNLYDGIDKARSDVALEIGKAIDLFSPVGYSPIPVAIFIDLASIGFSLIAARFWSGSIKEKAFWKGAGPGGDAHGVYKDTVNSAVTGSLTLVKDITKADPRLSAQNSFNDRIKGMTSAWYESIAAYNKRLFEGKDPEGLVQLARIIQAGQMVDSESPIVGTQEIKRIMRRAIFALLIPEMWHASNAQLYPFVYDTKKPCGYREYHLVIDPKVQERTGACFEGRQYFLVSTPIADKHCRLMGDIDTSCDPFPEPPGIQALVDGTYGVSVEDIVKAAVATKKANGGRLLGWGDQRKDPSDNDWLNVAQDVDVQAAGMNVLPICDFNEAYSNWEAAFRRPRRAAHHPCD